MVVVFIKMCSVESTDDHHHNCWKYLNLTMRALEFQDLCILQPIKPSILISKYICVQGPRNRVDSTLAYSSMRNEELGIWKRGISRKENQREKRENARIFSYSAKSTLKWFLGSKICLIFKENFWKSQKLSDKNAIEFKIWQIL